MVDLVFAVMLYTCPQSVAVYPVPAHPPFGLGCIRAQISPVFHSQAVCNTFLSEIPLAPETQKLKALVCEPVSSPSGASS